jgi:hypothetical protein
MDNTMGVQVSQSNRQLADEEARVVFGKSPSLAENGEELSPAIILHDKVELLASLESEIEPREEGAERQADKNIAFGAGMLSRLECLRQSLLE